MTNMISRAASGIAIGTLGWFTMDHASHAFLALMLIAGWLTTWALINLTFQRLQARSRKAT